MQKREKNLVIIAQKVDENDDLLGAFIDWIKEFSKHFTHVYVITLYEGAHHLPENVTVHSLGKEQGLSKLTQAYRLYRLLWKYGRVSDGVFAHMSPIFAVAAWPVTFVLRRKLVLWYLHRSVTLKLRAAIWLADHVVTAAPESLRIAHKKIIGTGHGIAIERFRSHVHHEHQDGAPYQIVSVGRLSPIKGFETLIEAARILKEKGFSFTVKIVGRTIMDTDKAYEQSLRVLRQQYGLEDVVEFVGFVPYDRVIDVYSRADVCVNLTPTGGIDKIVLEAILAGTLPLVSNTVFTKYFEQDTSALIFAHGDAAECADKIQALCALSHDERSAMVKRLQSSVEQSHSLTTLIDKISNLL